MAPGRSRLTSSAWLAGIALAFVGSAVLAGMPTHGAMKAASVERDLRSFEQAADGDLVFRAGRDMISQLVLTQSDTPRYSHVGVIVKRGMSTMVIHALPKEGAFAGGVVIEPLSKFASMENASSVGLYRVEGLSAKKRAQVREYLHRQVGKPFDDSFSMKDDSAMYCTELAVKSYADVGVDLAGKTRRIEIMTMPEPIVLPDALSAAPGVERVARLQGVKTFREAALGKPTIEGLVRTRKA